jgi:pimeloyl-ACP methyl ester carboxylesterase
MAHFHPARRLTLGGLNALFTAASFAALIGERTEPGAYACLRLPVLIIRGGDASGPTRLIADALSTLLPGARLAEIAGAGHMGP